MATLKSVERRGLRTGPEAWKVMDLPPVWAASLGGGGGAFCIVMTCMRYPAMMGGCMA